MAIVRNLIIRAGADFSELQKELQKAKTFMKNAGKELSNIGKSLTIGLTLPILAIGAAGLKSSSDLQEVQNVVDTAFGESAIAVNDWAKSTLSSFGLTELQAKQFSGTMRAMLGSMGLGSSEADDMSMKLSELAGDFASFYNLDNETAWEKIRSGISGEAEPLKQLGINLSVANLEAFAMSKGINTAWNEMTQAEQATLRYNYLLDVSKNAQGDFTKTQDSLANQLRVVKGTFMEIAGQLMSSFIPVFQDLMSKIQEGLSWFKGLTEEQQNFIVKLALVAAAIGPVLSVLGAFATASAGLLGWMKGIAGAMKAVQAGTQGLGAIFSAVFGPAGIVLLIILAVAAIAAAIYLIIKHWDDIKAKTIEIWTAITDWLVNVWSSISESAAKIWESIMSFFLYIWGSIKEATSSALIGIKQFFIDTWNGIKDLTTSVWEGIKLVVSAVLIFISDYIKEKLGYIYTFSDFIFTSIKDVIYNAWELIKNIVLGAILLILDLVTGNFTKLKSDAENIWNNIKEALVGIVTGIKDAYYWLFYAIWLNIKETFTEIKDFLIEIWDGIKAFFTTTLTNIVAFFTEAWSGLKEATKVVFNAIKDFIVETWDKLLNWLSELPGKMYELGVNIFTGLKDGIKSLCSILKYVITDGVENAMNFLKDLPGRMYDWGANAIGGFVDGIKSMISSVASAVTGVMDSIRGYLGFNSPAEKGEGRFITDWGANMVSGFMDGMRMQLPSLESVSSQLISFMNPTGGSGTSGTCNIVVELDGRVLAKALGQPLADEIRLRTGLRI